MAITAPAPQTKAGAKTPRLRPISLRALPSPETETDADRRKKLLELQRLAEEFNTATAALRALDAKELERRKRDEQAQRAILGRMIQESMDNDPKIAQTVRAQLDRYLTSPRERKLFGLAPLTTEE